MRAAPWEVASGPVRHNRRVLERLRRPADRLADRLSEAVAWRVGDRLAARGVRMVSPAPFFTAADGERERLDRLMMRAVLAAVLAPDSSYLDVGANRGQLLEHAVRLAPAGRHIAWEPLPALAAELRQRFPGVEVREAALGDRSGRAPFSHVLDDSGLSGLAERPLGDRRQERIEVAMERLDDVLAADVDPRLVKVDVEGAELAVFQGARETLARRRPHVLFEHTIGCASYHGAEPEQVWDVLVECGLRIFDLEGDGPLSRDQFSDAFHTRSRHNFLARA